MRFAVKSIRSLPIMCSVDQKSEPMQMAGDMTGTLAKGSLDVVRKKRPFKLASINIRLPIRSAGGGPAARHIILRNYFWRQPGDTAEGSWRQRINCSPILYNSPNIAFWTHRTCIRVGITAALVSWNSSHMAESVICARGLRSRETTTLGPRFPFPWGSRLNARQR